MSSTTSYQLFGFVKTFLARWRSRSPDTEGSQARLHTEFTWCATVGTTSLTELGPRYLKTDFARSVAGVDATWFLRCVGSHQTGDACRPSREDVDITSEQLPSPPPVTPRHPAIIPTSTLVLIALHAGFLPELDQRRTSVELDSEHGLAEPCSGPSVGGLW